MRAADDKRAFHLAQETDRTEQRTVYRSADIEHITYRQRPQAQEHDERTVCIGHSLPFLITYTHFKPAFSISIPKA